jgi:dolichyl-diphosphooligosaccharide---protein glycosyltransferase
VPSIISRGVAGSYDNEAVAIWALLNTFYLWIKSCNTGSITWSVVCTLNYFYMVTSWGGYSFIINIIPVFVLGTMFIGRFNIKIYVAYSIFYTLGTVLSLLVVFVNYQVMRSAEHLASHITFVVCNAYVLGDYIRQNLQANQIKAILNLALWLIFFSFVGLFGFLTVSGKSKISGRVMSLIDPSYANDHMPLIASVQEHSPSRWMNYFNDLNLIVYFVPVGFYYCLVHKVTHGKLFLAMYGVFAVYFSSAMIRLMLVLAPAACSLAAVAVSHIVGKATKSIRLSLVGKKQE